jgi:hypothetical protein
MSVLTWDQSSQRLYETGIDRGVLYVGGNAGIVWNGLISVEESYNGGESESYYYDGVKYLDAVANKDFKAKITAFSAPYEFSECIGEVPLRNGVYLTRQPRSRFGIAYRTIVGLNDYKIHIIYNAIASPVKRSYKTLSGSVSPDVLEWDISAVPTSCGYYRPTAHVTIDSRLIDSDKLLAIEGLLYGTDESYDVIDGNLIYEYDLDGDNPFGVIDGNASELIPGSLPTLPTQCEILDILNPIVST